MNRRANHCFLWPKSWLKGMIQTDKAKRPNHLLWSTTRMVRVPMTDSDSLKLARSIDSRWWQHPGDFRGFAWFRMVSHLRTALRVETFCLCRSFLQRSVVHRPPRPPRPPCWWVTHVSRPPAGARWWAPTMGGSISSMWLGGVPPYVGCYVFSFRFRDNVPQLWCI